MSAAPLQPTSFDLPNGLDDSPSTETSTTSTAPTTSAKATADASTSNASSGQGALPESTLNDLSTPLKSDRKAQLVMGPPLGSNPNETVHEGPELVENEEILAELSNEVEDLDLTHLRLRTLRGLGLERFKVVQRISLRQNLLSSLSYVPLPPTPAPDAGHSLTTTTTEATPTPDEVDEDSHDDEDAKKKEEDFEYLQSDSHAKREDTGWPLRDMRELEELDLYDNRIKSVKGLEGLVSLTSLDLSFNLLRHINQLEDTSPDSPFAYPLLDHLYLIQNKLSKIEGVKHRTNLVYLEFGGNRIREIRDLPCSANLRSLFLGKNKITKIQGLEGLTGLRTLSIQSNRIVKIEGLDTLTELEELYLSHNGIETIEGLSHNTKLTTLDIGNNKIVTVSITSLLPLPLLEEFWANDNQITSLPILPPSSHPALETIYLEGNPIQKEMGTSYNRRIMLEMPQVKQIDATFVRRS